VERYESYLRQHQARRAAAEAEQLQLCRRARAAAEAAAERLAVQVGARKVVLFGSLARGAFRPGSDIDLAIEGLAEGRILEALAAASEACEFEVNVVPVERARPYIQQAIEAEGVVLWPR